MVVADAPVMAKRLAEEDHPKTSVWMRGDYISQRIVTAVPAVAPFEVLDALRRSRGSWGRTT